MLLALGLSVMLLSAIVAFAARNNSPQMLVNPNGANKAAQSMLSAVCSGDYSAASSFMYGRPSLGSRPEDGSLAVELLWTAFLDSLEYEISEDCYVRETGVSLDVKLRSLDIAAVIQGMEIHAKEQLGRRVAAADDVTELYDSDNNFHQEIIDQILRDATMQSLAENKTYLEHTITLDLVFEQGRWWVLPNETLQSVLSGSF